MSSEKVKTVRQAIMSVSNDTIYSSTSLFRDDRVAIRDGVRDLTGDTYERLRKALCLPDDCRIIECSAHVKFLCNQTTLKIACERFAETEEAKQLPEVKAVTSTDGKGLRKFLRWEGDAIAGQAGAA